LATVVVWALWFARRPDRPPSIGTTVAILASATLVSGMESWLLSSLGVSRATGGNFSVILYGLSTGSREWTEAYRVFASSFESQPEREVFAMVLQKAIDNIQSQPMIFLAALAEAEQHYATNLFSVGSLTAYNDWLTGFFLFGVLVCLRRFRSPAHCLLLALMVGEALSAALVIDSAGHRLLSATVAARFLVVGIGVVTAIRMLMRIKLPGTADDAASRPVGGLAAYTAAGLGLLVLFLSVLSATPAASLWRLPSVEAPACDDGLLPVVSRVGRESMAISVGHIGSNPISHGVLTLLPGKLETDPARKGAWWAVSLPPLKAGETVLYAVQLGRGPDLGTFRTVLLEGLDKGRLSEMLLLCLDPQPTAAKLADTRLYHARYWRNLD
jgi:hypothetical protein